MTMIHVLAFGNGFVIGVSFGNCVVAMADGRTEDVVLHALVTLVSFASLAWIVTTGAP